MMASLSLLTLKSFALMVVTGVVLSGSAAAAPIYVFGPLAPVRQLVNILDIQVNAGEFDVAFVDGSFNSVFGSTPVLPFTLDSQGQAASTALDTLFVDMPPFATLETDPFLTQGCANNEACSVVTPMTFGSFAFQASVFTNVSPLYGTDSITTPYTDARASDYGAITSYTFAVWRESGPNAPASPYDAYFSPAAPVPEPSTFALVGIGVATLVAARRKRNRDKAVRAD